MQEPWTHNSIHFSRLIWLFHYYLLYFFSVVFVCVFRLSSHRTAPTVCVCARVKYVCLPSPVRWLSASVCVRAFACVCVCTRPLVDVLWKLDEWINVSVMKRYNRKCICFVYIVQCERAQECLYVAQSVVYCCTDYNCDGVKLIPALHYTHSGPIQAFVLRVYATARRDK